ncbi:MAG: MBL fold metallo-hydrolase, partial [Rhodospirillaceae bacterium]|nr:MBL fold metallo-hydrolase [Rhodospirillaceae bacterium]
MHHRDPTSPTRKEYDPLHRSDVTAFFDENTCTISYVVKSPDSPACAIIDPVLDFAPHSGRTGHKSADLLVQHVREHQLDVEWILETHVHADHLTAAPYLQETLGGKTAIGANIIKVQRVFGELFNAEAAFTRDGSQFARLFEDGDTFNIGGLDGRVIHTPGHTPACLTYLIGDSAFVGDTLFMPDYGSARCDFPGGDARTLYRSIHKLFALPDETRMWMCHDYKAPGRDEYAWETTVGAQKRNNIHVHEGVSENDFVAMRTKRDAGLDLPRLLLTAVQVNIRAGYFPPADDN